MATLARRASAAADKQFLPFLREHLDALREIGELVDVRDYARNIWRR